MRRPSAVVPVKVSFPTGWLALTSTRAAFGSRATSSTACPGRWTPTVSGRRAPSTTSRFAPRYSIVQAVTLPSPAKLARYRGDTTSATATAAAPPRGTAVGRGALAPGPPGAGTPGAGVTVSPVRGGSGGVGDHLPDPELPSKQDGDGQRNRYKCAFFHSFCLIVSGDAARSAPARQPPPRPADRRDSSGPVGGQ